jgi:hypothetical protein
MGVIQVTDPSLTSPKEPPPSATSALFSKFTRSPSRRHRPRPSSDSIEEPPAPPSKPTKQRPRPGLQRTTTDSAAPAALNGIREHPKKDDAKSPIEGKMDVSGFALAGAVRQPTFKVAEKKSKDEVPDVPSINGAALEKTNSAQMSSVGTPYQHIHEMSSKRMATLDYMRKAWVL